MWVERGENLEEAGEMIKKALASEPDNGSFMDSLGWYYFKKGEYEKALEQLLKAVEAIKPSKPEDAVVLEHVGDTYQQLGKTPACAGVLAKGALARCREQEGGGEDRRGQAEGQLEYGEVSGRGAQELTPRVRARKLAVSYV